MTYGFYLAGALGLAVVSVTVLRYRALYLLFAIAYLQNLVIPLLYTTVGIDLEACRAMLLFKEYLLLALFIYSLLLLSRFLRRPWPRPFVLLLFFTAYCALRFALGVAVLGDEMTEGLRTLRMVGFPLQVFTVGMLVTRVQPEMASRVLRRTIWLLAALALFSEGLFFLVGTEFWVRYANVALYNVDVKGDDPSSVFEDLGVSGSAVGRSLFSGFEHRAFGTFGDPLAMGFALGAPTLFLLFWSASSRVSRPAAAISALGVFLTFSRSAWVFLFVAVWWVLWMRGEYRKLAALTVLVAGLLVAFQPVTDLATASVQSLAGGRPEDLHARGLIWLYTRGLTDVRNLLGKGMSSLVREVPESGYAFLLEHFGAVALVTFVSFFASVLHTSLRVGWERSPLMLLAQGLVIATLVVTHFAEYSLSFVGYLLVWFWLGVSIGAAETARVRRAATAFARPLASGFRRGLA